MYTFTHIYKASGILSVACHPCDSLAKDTVMNQVPALSHCDMHTRHSSGRSTGLEVALVGRLMAAGAVAHEKGGTRKGPG